MKKYKLIMIFGVFAFLLMGAVPAFAEGLIIPKLNFIQPAETAGEVSATMQILLMLVVLSVAPAVILMVTSFTRVAIVLTFLKRAIGIQQIPNQIVLALALFISVLVMMPVWNEIQVKAYQPYMKETITQAEAVGQVEQSFRHFMFKNTREKDLALFSYFSKVDDPKSPEDIPTYVVIPAFILSELKTAFIYGFLIYIPFLIVDLVVSTVLVAMGMLVLPPMMISVPMKLLLFVLVDGWYLVARSLVGGFVT